MSYSANQPNDPWAQQPQPPRQANWGLRLLLGCLVVGGLMIVGCCGLFGWMLYSMQPTVVEQPAEVRQMASEIAEIDAPQGLEARQGFKMKIPVIADMRGVVYEADETKNGVMMLMEFDSKIEGFGQKEMRDAMRQGIGNADKNVNIKQSQTREFTIRGTKCNFTFSEGENTETGQKIRMVSGTFPGKESGVVILWLMVPAERYDEAELEEMVKSIE